MFKKVLVGQILLIIITIGYAQVWIARYQGPYGEDNPNAIAVEDEKNIYVTGASQGEGAGFINDFATIKYDSLGIEQWVARYNGSPTRNWRDEARAIAVDANGVYVTGYISYYILEDSSDYCTIKYDKETGDTLWLRKYNGPENKCDQACAIGLDNVGNVYVTGKSKNANNDFDYLTIKYSPAGVELWTARYNNPTGDGWDIAYALAVDNLGNVYVTGESYDLTTYYDCTTVKYNSQGVQQWVRRYSYQENWSDEGNAITVDDSGNVYVTGRSVSTTTSWDYATIKYNTGGAQQWVARYHGMENYEDEPTGIALDNLGNIYVTGKSGIGSFRYQFATVKYLPDGTQDWVRTYLGPANLSAEANAIAVDNQNNICVTGRDYGSDSTAEYVTIKYLPDSTEQWIARYYTSVDHGDDWATAICVDEDNCIYVTGSSQNEDDDLDYLTLKYLPSGASIKESPNPKSKNQNSKLSVFPNPFKTQIVIRYMPSGSSYEIKIYDISGKLVKSFFTSHQSIVTNYCLIWDGTDNSDKRVPSGVYCIRLKTQKGSYVVRIIRK